MALFSYPVCTWLCQYVNMGVRKWLEKSAEKQKYKLCKTLNPLSRKAFRAVSFSATKDMSEQALYRLLRVFSAQKVTECRRSRSHQRLLLHCQDSANFSTRNKYMSTSPTTKRVSTSLRLLPQLHQVAHSYKNRRGRQRQTQ